MSLAVVTILVWFVSAGSMFVEATPNDAARIVVGLAAVLILVDVLTKLYRVLGQEAPHL